MFSVRHWMEFFFFLCSLQAPTPAQSRSVNKQNMTEFATGLMIGKTTSVGSNQTECIYTNVCNF